MSNPPIREYCNAVYVYWLGRELPTVKIGLSNNPERRLLDFARETGTPGHKAAFAAVVHLDRRMYEVEQEAHRRLAAKRRNGEWFAVTAEQALATVIDVAEHLGLRYEVEDCAGLLPETLRQREEAVAAVAAFEEAECQRIAAADEQRRAAADAAEQARVAASNNAAAEVYHARKAIDDLINGSLLKQGFWVGSVLLTGGLSSLGLIALERPHKKRLKLAQAKLDRLTNT